MCGVQALRVEEMKKAFVMCCYRKLLNVNWLGLFNDVNKLDQEQN